MTRGGAGQVHAVQVSEVARLVIIRVVETPETQHVGPAVLAGEIQTPGLAVLPVIIHDAKGDAHFKHPCDFVLFLLL